ncbi:hypothetical protein [Vibrio vulnificus YJ016]|uniref:Uncharacterized protein n=1 Tax=Vibrio vulnificus (strain YJ016) TaxID=196600 RepID=Q7ME57_VIBVY|nr:hypothetical protein [Vibrio vulnificus YJ016]
MFFSDQPDFVLFGIIKPIYLALGIIVVYGLFYMARKIRLRIDRLKAEREVFEAELAKRRASDRIDGAPFRSDSTGYLSGFHPGTPCIRTGSAKQDNA